jgi:hypothetical protein
MFVCHSASQLIKDLFIKRVQGNDWDEQGDYDATEFLEIEKLMFLDLPTCKLGYQ